MMRDLPAAKTKLTGQFFYRREGENRQDKSETASLHASGGCFLLDDAITGALTYVRLLDLPL
jgi:hypothetical protein